MSADRPKILVFSDSRGRGIQEFIQQHPESCKYDNIVRILPGRDLIQIAHAATQAINDLPSDKFYCVIFAGICGLTERTTISGTRRIHYPLDNRTSKTENIITTRVVHI